MSPIPRLPGLAFAAIGLLARLWRAVRPPGVVIAGSCAMCGRCCQGLVLWHDGAPLSDPAVLEQLVAVRPELTMLRPVRRSARGHLVFDCSHLGDDGRCAIHASRPDFCRRFPSPAYIAAGGELLDGCGYRVSPH